MGIALVGCGGSSSGGSGGTPADQPSVGSDQIPVTDTTGMSGDEGGEGGDDVGCNDGDECNCGECPQTYCWDFCTEKDVSYVIVATDCPDLVSDVTVRDLISDDLVGNLYPKQPSAAVCPDDTKLTGFKVEDIESRSIRVCVTTTLPRDAFTIQLKYALTCENISGACAEQ